MAYFEEFFQGAPDLTVEVGVARVGANGLSFRSRSGRGRRSGQLGGLPFLIVSPVP